MDTGRPWHVCHVCPLSRVETVTLWHVESHCDTSTVTYVYAGPHSRVSACVLPECDSACISPTNQPIHRPLCAHIQYPHSCASACNSCAKTPNLKRFFLARPFCVDVRCLTAGNEEDGVCANPLDEDSFITWFRDIRIFLFTCQCMHYSNKWTHEQINPSADPCVHTSNVLMHVLVIWFREFQFYIMDLVATNKRTSYIR